MRSPAPQAEPQPNRTELNQTKSICAMPAVDIRHLSTASASFEVEFQRVLHWSAETDDAIEQRVAGILADVTQRSHRTPRPTKVLGDTNPFVLQGPNMEDPVMCTGSLLHAYGGLGLRRGSNHGMSSRD